MLSSVHSKHGAGRYLTQRWGSLHFALPPLDLKCDQHLKCDKHLKCDQNKPNLDRPIVFHFQVTQAKPTQGSYSQEELSPDRRMWLKLLQVWIASFPISC